MTVILMVLLPCTSPRRLQGLPIGVFPYGVLRRDFQALEAPKFETNFFWKSAPRSFSNFGRNASLETSEFRSFSPLLEPSLVQTKFIDIGIFGVI